MEIGSYAKATQLLYQEQTYLERNGGGSACHSLNHCLSEACPPLVTLGGLAPCRCLTPPPWAP